MNGSIVSYVSRANKIEREPNIFYTSCILAYLTYYPPRLQVQAAYISAWLQTPITIYLLPESNPKRGRNSLPEPHEFEFDGRGDTRSASVCSADLKVP